MTTVTPDDGPAASATPPPAAPAGGGPPTPAVPVQPIAYHDDAEALRPWVAFVRGVAAVGLAVASASAGQFIIGMMPTIGFAPILPFTVRPFVPTLLTIVPNVLLLVGSVGCLTLRPYGRRFMIAYGIVALLMVLVSIGSVVVIAATGQLGITRGSRQAVGYALYFGLQFVQSAALPAVILTLMRRPTVRRVFEPR